MLKEFLRNLANAFRSSLETTEPINAQDFVEKVSDVKDYGFYLGYQNGIENGEALGRQAEYDEFWDNYQQNGNRTNYYFGFYFWRDAVYRPKYKITVGTGAAIFQNSAITDTRVDIDVSGCTNALGQMFNNAIHLKTVRKIIVAETTTYSGWFTGCSKLENLTIEGVIGNSINIYLASLLTIESMRSIISALKDYSGSTTTYTLTLHATAKAKLTETDIATITQKGWTLA